MVTPRFCPSCLSLTSSTRLLRTSRASSNFFLPPPAAAQGQIRTAVSANAVQHKKKPQEKGAGKKKKSRAEYAVPDLRHAIQFSLVDAMRYFRAAEVGRPPTSSKYELHVRLRTNRGGAVIRNRIRLPHPIRTDLRICIIAPPDSTAGKAAIAAGAAVVGEETVFEAVKAGRIEFDRCYCHTDSLPKLGKSGIGRILGPRGLMPSAKFGTVVKDVAHTVRDAVGSSVYRERQGVIRIGIGQLGFAPEELQRNIKAFIDALKKDMAGISDRTPKEIHEVVLSSTNGPGLSLTGDLKGEDSIDVRDLSTL